MMLPQDTGLFPLIVPEMKKNGRSIGGPAGVEIGKCLDNHPGVILSIAYPGAVEKKQNSNEILCAVPRC